MVRFIDGEFIRHVEEPGQCETCGELAELRPYGPNDENICIECGQKDPETTVGKMKKHLLKMIGGYFDPERN